MKTFTNYFLGMFAIMSLSNCANGKKLQEEAPMALQPAYYVVHLAQGDSNASRYNLYIPTGEYNEQEIQLDSVFFRGRKAEIISSGELPFLHVAYFEVPGKDKSFVMHVDPEKEYGNQAPVLEKFPFELKADEAVVVYTKNEEQGYFKIKGITQRGSDGEEIKKPENIRH